MNPLSSSRTVKLFGEAAVAKIESSKVLVVGLGGVGSFAAEAIARGGVGTLTLLDDDRIEHSNLKRQLTALNSTIGKLKTEEMRDRILDINPETVVDVLPIRFDNN
ncbi:MAG: tRNA threonylcarbamoyladenosine dehydratase, partial [Lentisphaerae bacterium]|nr:tRNA threonylcarbamoyladenosine dehydratase [Lentisphaerota bacterium]